MNTLCVLAKNSKTVIITDSCRVRDGRTPALTKEEQYIITDVPPENSEFIMEFATSPNDYAYDGGNGANSIFASFLLPYLDKKDMDLNSILCHVRKEMKERGISQRSWTHHSLSEPLFIANDIYVGVDWKSE